MGMNNVSVTDGNKGIIVFLIVNKKEKRGARTTRRGHRSNRLAREFRSFSTPVHSPRQRKDDVYSTGSIWAASTTTYPFVPFAETTIVAKPLSPTLICPIEAKRPSIGGSVF